MTNNPEYNSIFERFVDNKSDDDVYYAMIGYARYKIEKRKWMRANPINPLDVNAEKDHKKKLEGFLAHYDDEKIQQYCRDAERDLEVFGQNYFAGKSQEFLELIKQSITQVEDKFKGEILQVENNLKIEINKNKTSWKESLVQGLTLAVISPLFLLVLAVLMRLFVPGKIVTDIINYLSPPPSAVESQLQNNRLNQNSPKKINIYKYHKNE